MDMNENNSRNSSPLSRNYHRELCGRACDIARTCSPSPKSQKSLLQMELGVSSWGLARLFPKLLHSEDNSRSSCTGTMIRADGVVERGGVGRRYEDAAGGGCRRAKDSFTGSVLLPSLSESMCSRSRRRMRMLVVTNASKSRFWKAEPLVKGSVTRRALHIVKILRSSSNLQADEIDAALQKWVVSMQPNRKDWLNVLKEFDNKVQRPLYFKISGWGLEQSWFEAGVRDYTKLIDKYGKEGYVVEAERTLRIMEERGVVPNLETYTVMVAVYGRAKMLERVHEVLQELSLSGLELDAVFYKTMIIAYGSAGLLKEAEDVLTRMESAEAAGGMHAYLALVTAYGRLGQATDAQRIFDRMHLKGFRGDLKAFTALMEAYSNAKDYSNAELIFQSLRAAGLKPDDRALASLVSVYANANMLTRAAEVVVELENAGMKTGPITLTSLIGWFGKAGLIEEAKQCFDELKRKGLPISDKAYTNMFAAYARVGDLRLADSIWVAIEEDGIVLDDRACRVIVESIFSGQFHERGQKFFLAALQARGWEPPADLKINLAAYEEVVA